ncbi:helix-turn-helix transcriptional regulator [Pyxidicoccus parkwayensis]|uniref:Helix-turn-helix transcriptional regulator n=1 Tax=Pyxidicoccus parkwayensis TaxID=2813578 RepID=A0ABX7P6E6_9BACT|nr:AraC family transcriptional regulator [Pyxidicoccus parkwaysis]QSQ26021.1 helix-turn-helix transcriptional regulator [Pyxidicoccus parkwaysis]
MSQPFCAYETPDSPHARPPGIERYFIHGRRFAGEMHHHPVWEIGLLEAGVVTTETDSRLYTQGAGSHGALFFVPPGAPHAASADPRHLPMLRSLHLEPHVVTRALEGISRRPVRLPTEVTALEGARAAHSFLRFHQRLGEGASQLEWETWLVEALVDLFVLRDEDAVLYPVGLEARAVRRAREYLHAHATERVSLEDLAQAVGLSKYHLARVFARETGLPPHTYVQRLRLARALPQLRQGAPAGEVAYALGFADQAHFARTFKDSYGLTPRAYARGA